MQTCAPRLIHRNFCFTKIMLRRGSRIVLANWKWHPYYFHWNGGFVNVATVIRLGQLSNIFQTATFTKPPFQWKSYGSHFILQKKLSVKLLQIGPASESGFQVNCQWSMYGSLYRIAKNNFWCSQCSHGNPKKMSVNLVMSLCGTKPFSESGDLPSN